MPRAGSRQSSGSLPPVCLPSASLSLSPCPVSSTVTTWGEDPGPVSQPWDRSHCSLPGSNAQYQGRWGPSFPHAEESTCWGKTLKRPGC